MARWRFAGALLDGLLVNPPSRQDTTYHFVVNQGTQPHEFMIAPPLSDVQGHSVQMDRSISLIDVQNIPPGEAGAFDITLSKPSNTPLEFASHEGSDYQNGPHLAITVV